MATPVLPGLSTPLGGAPLGVVTGGGATATITGYSASTGVVSGTAPPNLLVVVSAAGTYAGSALASASGAWAVGIGLVPVARTLSAAAVPAGYFSAAASPFSTWNPNDAASGLVFSNGNLTAKPPAGSASTYYNARGTSSRSSGKYYFEVICIAAGGSEKFGTGVAGSAASLSSSTPGSATQIFDDGTFVTSGSSAGSTGSSFAANTVVGMAVDMGGGTMQFYTNGTAASAAKSIPSGAIFPFIINQQGGGGGTLNVGASAFAYTPPSGYSAWG